MSKLLLIADPHIGANKFGMSAEQWDRPMAEALATLGPEDACIVAGDSFHYRNPTVAQVRQFNELLSQAKCSRFYILAGNHDQTAPNRTNALYLLKGATAEAAQVTIDNVFEIHDILGLKVGMLQWPMMSLFEIDNQLPVEQQLLLARDALMGVIQQKLTAAGIEKLDLFTGHVHFVEGDGSDTGPDPRMLAGRDILLPIEWVRQRSRFVFAGHIHKPIWDAYIGSTQPTDLGDTLPKSYVVFENGIPEVREYQTSMRLYEVEMPAASLMVDPVQIWNAVYSADPANLVDPSSPDDTHTGPKGLHLKVHENPDLPHPIDFALVRKVLLEKGFDFVQTKSIPSPRIVRVKGADIPQTRTPQEEVIEWSAVYLNDQDDVPADVKEQAMAKVRELVGGVPA